ncbi:MAG: choice-of-anchor I family protein, partial [Acidobacteriota bacterium]
AGSLPGIAPGAGRIDVTIANILGLDASALGNHEFDAGEGGLATIIAEAVVTEENDDGDDIPVAVDGLEDIVWLGATFPYLSANLDFSMSGALGPIATTDIVASDATDVSPADFVAGADGDGAVTPTAKIAPEATIERDGELIGVIGATTQLLASISSPGDTEVLSGGSNDMAALAAIIQPIVDQMTADGINKIILASHLQQIALEQELAGLLSGVDVIIAGGSDTIVADADDRLRPGDEAADGGYPLIVTGADGNDVAVVSTAGSYTYVGRLVVEFDEDGTIIADSIDDAETGAFATDDQGVLDVTGEATLEAALDASEKASDVGFIASAVQDFVDELAANAPGFSDVYLDGRRGQVRTQETNLGNLTADANLAKARESDATVQISLKNGGGIRDDIGDVVLDNDGTASFEPPFGNAVTELDIQNALRFDNELTLLTVSSEDLLIILEHAVADSEPGNTPGRFPQIAGVQVSYDPEGTAQVLDEDFNVVTPGSRVQSVTLLDVDGQPAQTIVADGTVFDSAPAAIRIVTLSFLADGGDGYPYPALAEDRVDTGVGEQQALSEFLAAEHGTEETAFDNAETGPGLETRIQNLDERSDTAAAPQATGELDFTRVATFDSGAGEGGSEVVAHAGGRLFVTNGEDDRIDVFPLDGSEASSIDLSFVTAFDGVQSVAATDEIVIAVAAVGATDGVPSEGVAAIFDAATLQLIAEVPTGNLPDSVAISPDGRFAAIANEGEFNGESDLTVNAPGSVTLIDLSGDTPTATVVGFEGADTTGLRLFPGIDPTLDIEPEYVTFGPDGTTLYVTLQENNGVAVIDAETGTIIDILALGTVDNSVEGFGFDATDDDVVDIVTRGTVSLRLPDALVATEIGGETYILTANEGDGRGDVFDPEEVDVAFGDEARVGDLLDAGVIDPSVDTTGLERLNVSTIDGDTDGDGDIDVLTAFGTRSFTIFAADGTVVFDSGDDFEQIIAARAPERFNDDDGELGQNRSDAKGPEPEAIEVGVIDGDTYAFIGLERDSGIVVYNISDPEMPRFVDYIEGFGTGDISPEVIDFIPAGESTTGNAQIAVSYEVSGTTSVFDIAPGPARQPVPEVVKTTSLLYGAALDRTPDDTGLNFWIDAVQDGLTELQLSNAFLSAPEFEANFEAESDQAFVDLLFQNVLGRDADAD